MIVRQRYYILDLKNKLKSCGLFSSEEIQRKFNLKNQATVYKICERQQILRNQYILVECVIKNRKEEKGVFTAHLFHENKRYLYYLTIHSTIIQKSKKSNIEIEYDIPKNKIYKIDEKQYELSKLKKNYFC